MRELVSFLFLSLDGVVEAPDRFMRPDLYGDLDLFGDETFAGQDAVLLGRRTYEEWSAFWPGSDIQPFADFINGTPKFVASNSLAKLDWAGSSAIAGDTLAGIAALKATAGGTIGVHGSIGLVQSLLGAGLVDELRLLVCPAIAGQGRRLLSREGEPIQLDLRASRTSPGGLQYLAYRPRR